MLVYLGNVKGPKGDKGDKGEPGIQGPMGPVGPKGETGPLPPLVNNFNGAEEGTAALDANTGPNIVDKSMISNEQVNSEDKVPSSNLVYSMQEDINRINENIGKQKIWPAYNFKQEYPDNSPGTYGSIVRMTGESVPHNFVNDSYFIATDEIGRMFTGTQVNNEDTITWRNVALETDLNDKVDQTQYSTFLKAPTGNAKQYLGINTAGKIFKQIDETAYSIPYYRYNQRDNEAKLLHYTFISNERHFFGFFTSEGSLGTNGYHGIISIDLNYNRDDGSITKLTDTAFTFELSNVTSEGFDIDVKDSAGGQVKYLALNVFPM